MQRAVRILAMSDTHDTHSSIDVASLPAADFFIHAGDFTQYSYKGELKRFREFLRSLPYKHKIVIAGNHDFALDTDNYATKHKPKRHKYQKMVPEEEIELLKQECVLLQHEPVTIDGVKIFGSPMQPLYYNWGFQYHQSRQDSIWKDIPQGLDVLVTHGPPFGVLDSNSEGLSLGCKGLREAVLKTRPKIHIFGHVHNGYGVAQLQATKCYNVAVLNQAYQLTKQPVLIELG